MTAGSSGRWLGIVAVLLALGTLGWVAAGLVDRLYTAGGAPDRTGDALERSTTADSREHEFEVSRIIDAHLFGTPEQNVAEEVTHAPETKLRLNLAGLVASADERYARAIIGVNNNRVKPYTVGQTIDGTDASVHAVEENRVLLKRGDALESLLLKRNQIELLNPRPDRT